MSQDNGEEFKKQTSHWLNTDRPRPYNSQTSSAPVASSSTLRVDKGKGKEVAPSPEARGFTARDVKGKAKEVNPLFDLSTLGHSQADEEISSLGAAAQRRPTDLGRMGPPHEDMIGGGTGGSDDLNSSFAMGSIRDIGGRTLSGLESLAWDWADSA